MTALGDDQLPALACSVPSPVQYPRPMAQGHTRPPRHAGHPPGRAAVLGLRPRHGRAAVRALRLRPDRHADVRGRDRCSCAASATSRTSSQKEMYVFEDRGGQELALRPGGHGARLPRVPRARDAQPAAAGAPLLPRRPSSATTARRPAATASTTSSASRRSARPTLAWTPRSIELLWRLYEELGLTGLTLNLNSHRRPELPPALPRRAARLLPRQAATASATTAAAASSATRCDCSTARASDASRSSPARRRSPTTSATTAAITSRRSARTSRPLGIPYVVNPRLVRGLDYYTRTVFEVQPKEEGGQSTRRRRRPLRRPDRAARRPPDARASASAPASSASSST